MNERIARLAIGRYPGEPGVYLFYCDAAWTVITDSLHDSFEGALRQPNFEFDGVTFTQVG